MKYIFFALIIFLYVSCSKRTNDKLNIGAGSNIVLVGNNLGSRMMDFGYFETEMHLRYPKDSLFIRNMCDGGNTPGFRPNAGRKLQWAYEGAEKFYDELTNDSRSGGHFETPDEWLTRLQADVIIAFFGYSESFNGKEGLVNFKNDLEGFIKNTLSNNYNGETPPQLAIVSPIAFEDLSNRYDLPNGKKENQNLKLYAEAMKEVSKKNNVLFIDAFNPSKTWQSNTTPITIDGFQLNDVGFRMFSKFLVEAVFGKINTKKESLRNAVNKAVNEKNFYWEYDFKIPNAVHAYGVRYDPFGPDNYPDEIKKTRQMTAIRDTAIWSVLNGNNYNLAIADSKTLKLKKIETNYKLEDNEEEAKYLYGDDALKKFKLAPGYKIEMFASEVEFPDLANPVQISFDNKGRLWVATMPSYPHFKPGDEKPNDKLLILEDTDNDGKADKQIVFAENLHLPTGFEFAPEGVYVAQSTRLKLLTDTDGDDKCDKVETILSGFDDHDTHHVISAFTTDPSGAIYMGEGLFLHSNVETPYGTLRGAWGGVFRYAPQQKRLDRVAQADYINPWGIAFNHWGQPFIATTSAPDVHWLTPTEIKTDYAIFAPKSKNIIEQAHKVRPTSGLEFISSRHFPDYVQGDMLIGNCIGFLGIKQHQVMDNGAGYKSKHRQDLVQSSDTNFRPVDMEFAPDGSLYFIDWHNVLIGHMQHNARDPLRDHKHGRVYRITYPSRPLLKPAKVFGASIDELLNNLKLPEYRTRYRSRRELRGRNADEVMDKLSLWLANLDKSSSNHEYELLEGLWVSWAMNRLDTGLLEKLLKAKDFNVRSASVQVLRNSRNKIPGFENLLETLATDESARVRLEALVTASWLTKQKAQPILEAVKNQPMDDWINMPLAFTENRLGIKTEKEQVDEVVEIHLKGDDLKTFAKGKEIYHREGYCVTCHQENGMGLPASGFPPLAGTKWVVGSEDRLIKLTLNGLHGPIKVLGKEYPGQVPMTQFKGLLNDEEMAQVLTYVRNAFGNKASVILPESIKKIREEIKDFKGFYNPEDLEE